MAMGCVYPVSANGETLTVAVFGPDRVIEILSLAPVPVTYSRFGFCPTFGSATNWLNGLFVPFAPSSTLTLWLLSPSIVGTREKKIDAAPSCPEAWNGVEYDMISDDWYASYAGPRKPVYVVSYACLRPNE